MSSSLKIACLAVFLLWASLGCTQAGDPLKGQDIGTPRSATKPGGNPGVETDRREQDIEYDLAAYARTGEYGYLCHAALLGSKVAIDRLQREGLICSYR